MQRAIYNPSSSIEDLPRLGRKISLKFKRLGIKKIQDLIFYFPRQYADLRKVTPIAKAPLDTSLAIQGKIINLEERKTYQKRASLTSALIQDNSGPLYILWFNQPYISSALKKGERVFLAGKITSSKKYGREMINPHFEKFSQQMVHTGRIIPLYPETSGLSSRMIRRYLFTLLPTIRKISDYLPDFLIKGASLFPLNQALEEIHFPKNFEVLKKAQERLSFDELLFLFLRGEIKRRAWKKNQSFVLPPPSSVLQNFIQKLPYKLTADQEIALKEILEDLQKSSPMHRLLEGEVGSGKTIIALISLLHVALSEMQGVFLAPTEILAVQHYQRSKKLLKKMKIKTALLLGSTKKADKNKIKKNLLKGKIQIIFGTHALLQKEVEFKNLALVVVDEQHRFGVEQRALLLKQKIVPHLLSMTATPIPRTLALVGYGDLDISFLKNLPQGRPEVITKLVLPAMRERTYQFIREKIKAKEQALVICPLISDSEKLEVKSVTEEFKKISQDVFPDLTTAMLHGKMKAEEKKKIMEDLEEKKIDVLVATSLVEVGIDIPTLTIIMIEGAERFGLAQLHQLRGRVRRSTRQGYCFLFPTFDSSNKERLRVLEKTNDGFKIAEADLKFRGPGEMWGTKQAGFFELKIAKLTDIVLIKKSQTWAKKILSASPDLSLVPQIKEKLIKEKSLVHLE